jgi:hypothetical protein
MWKVDVQQEDGEHGKTDKPSPPSSLRLCFWLPSMEILS